MPAPKQSLTRNLAEAFAAVIAGNAVYFLVAWRHLPAAARHEVDRLDLGLLVDFWFCLVAYGLIRTAMWWRQKKSRRQKGNA